MSNLTLPQTAVTEKYSHENHDGDKITVYRLFDAGNESMELQHCSAQDSAVTNSYTLCHTAFKGSSLADVLEHHSQVVKEEQLHPTIFIVAHSVDYEANGVLLIDANFDLKGGVDTCRAKASVVVLQAVNLQIGNLDWFEIEREDQIEPQDEQKPANSTGNDEGATVFGVYGIKIGANMTTIRDLLEPGWLENRAKEWLCESVGSYTEASDPLREVVKHHP